MQSLHQNQDKLYRFYYIVLFAMVFFMATISHAQVRRVCPRLEGAFIANCTTGSIPAPPAPCPNQAYPAPDCKCSCPFPSTTIPGIPCVVIYDKEGQPEGCAAGTGIPSRTIEDSRCMLPPLPVVKCDDPPPPVPACPWTCP